MAGDRRSGTRRGLGDILVDVGYEAAMTGERMADVVFGPRESARRHRQPRAAGAPRQAAAASGYTPPRGSDYGGEPHSIVGKLADLTADVLDRFEETFRDIAEHERFAPEPEVPRLDLRGHAGSVVTEDFRFSNTGSTALKAVTFAATDLLGPGHEIDASAVSFEHGEAREQHIERVGPRRDTWVTVAVAIPSDAPAGEYHGVIAAGSPPPSERDVAEAGPLGAWALVELEVLATDASRRR